MTSCSVQHPCYAYRKEKESEMLVAGLLVDLLTSSLPKMPNGGVECCGSPTCQIDGSANFCDACGADCEECRHPEGGL